VQEVSARVAYHDRVTDSATARIVVRTERQRLMTALRGGLGCWGLAVLSVFIPLGHFFLVPGFLIAGPVLFFRGLAESVTLKGAHGVCPMCGKEQEFAERGRLLARHPVRCSACGRELALIAEVPGFKDKPAAPPDQRPEVHVWTAGGED